MHLALLRTSLLALCTCFSLATTAASSSSSASSIDRGKPPGPPPEAVTACKGKSEGSEVSFTGRNGESFSGTCQTIDGVLAAMPKGGRPGGKGGGQNPPPPPR